ncbi:MAG: hypothetical protein HC904_09485 [Blastochloris sp.]|nr:hypothetical protein [Blastochloris sp.]
MLTVDADGAVTLLTNVVSADVETTQAGAITITEDNAITLSNLTTFNGLISVLAIGDLNAVNVVSGTSSAANSISLTSTLGNLTAGIVNSGALGQMVLNAGQAILDAAGKITAKQLLATSVEGAVLDTQVESLSITNTGLGSVIITESDALILNTATTVDGDVSITTGGALSLTTVTAGNGGDVILDAGGAISQLSGKVTGNMLTVDADGAVTLLTNVVSADVETTQAGAITITEHDAIDLIELTTFNGNISVQAGGTIRAGAITAGMNGDVILNATSGAIERLGGSLIMGDDLNATAVTGINLNTRINSLSAVNTGLGDVVVTEFDGLTLNTATTVNGDVSITTGGALSLTTVTAGSGGDVTLDVSGAISQLSSKVTGNMLTVDADGAVTLLTDVVSVQAHARAAGAITITEDTGLILQDIRTDDGSITVLASGLLQALSVISLTNAAANFVSLTSTQGNLELGQVQAGNLADLTLSAANGTILNLPGKIEANVLTVLAKQSIRLDTSVNRLNVQSTGLGDILITETDAVILDLVRAQAGSIQVIAGGMLTASQVISTTDDAAHDLFLQSTVGDLLAGLIDAKSLGSVTLIAAGSILNAAGVVRGKLLEATAAGGIELDTEIESLVAELTAAGDLVIREANNLTDIDISITDGAVDIEAGGDLVLNGFVAAVLSDDNDLRLVSLGGDLSVGELQLGTEGDVELSAQAGSISSGLITADELSALSLNALNLETAVNTLSAEVTGTGDLTLNEFDALDLTLARTFNGSIFIKTGAELSLGRIESSDEVQLDIGGGITQSSGILQASLLTLEATGAVQIWTQVNQANIHVKGSGDLVVLETDGIELLDVKTDNGSITVEAGGALTVTDVQSLTDSASNDIWLETSMGNILVETLNAGSLGDVSLKTGAGSVLSTLSGLIKGNLLEIEATTGIGLNTQVAQLQAINNGVGDITISEVDTLWVTELTTLDGAVDLSTGAALTLETLMAGNGGNVTLDAGGNIVQETGKLTGSLLQAVATGSITLRTNVDEAILSTRAAGDIRILECDSITLLDVDAFDGSINIRAGAALRALDLRSLRDRDVNDIDLISDMGDLSYGLVSAGVLGDLSLTATAGAILPETTGSLLTGDRLTALSRDGMTLQTNVADIMAESTGAGDLFITEANAVTLRDVETADGAIEIRAGGNIRAERVVSQNSVDANQISVEATSGNIQVAEINAGAGADVFLRAQGSLQDLAGGRITARLLDAQARTSLALDTAVSRILARSSLQGSITITELDDVLADEILTTQGQISITTGGVLEVNTITAGGVRNVTLKSGDAVVQNTGKVSGALLKVEAEGSITLLTAVLSADLSTTALGDVSLTEDDAISLNNVQSFNGSITVTALGNISTARVLSLTDSDDNDLSLLSTGGNIQVGLVSAGSTAGDVFLEALGSISMLSGLSTGANRVRADFLQAVARNGINLVTEANLLDAWNGRPGMWW